MSNRIFIERINESLKRITDKYSPTRIFGLAESITQEDGENPKVFPALIDQSGEAKYVGIDDSFALTFYHKSNSISVSEKPGSGYGDSRALKVYSYSNVLMVQMDGEKVKYYPDEMALLIEANFPEIINAPFKGSKSIQLKIESVVLNTLNVLNSEYRNLNQFLPLNYYLFAIYYKVESVLDKKCLINCP